MWCLKDEDEDSGNSLFGAEGVGWVRGVLLMKIFVWIRRKTAWERRKKECPVGLCVVNRGVMSLIDRHGLLGNDYNIVFPIWAWGSHGIIKILWSLKILLVAKWGAFWDINNKPWLLRAKEAKCKGRRWWCIDIPNRSNRRPSFVGMV